jgi:hypothetical protein
MTEVVRAVSPVRAGGPGGQTRKVADLLGRSRWTGWSGYPKTPGRKKQQSIALCTDFFCPDFLPTQTTQTTRTKPVFMRLSGNLSPGPSTLFTWTTRTTSRCREPLSREGAADGIAIEDLLVDMMLAFEERAAIAEFDGGLDRDAAERLAWAEVTASLEDPGKPDRLHTGPADDDATAWRAWMRSRIPVWRARGLTTAEAVRSVWSEAEDRWHRQHGATPDPDRCAGCGEWMLDGPGMTFDDGAVVHFGNPDRLDCLIIYGEAWRAAASAGLVALGLRKPQP